MAEVVKFDRKKHKVVGRGTGLRSGVRFAKDQEVSDADLAKLSDDDVERLRLDRVVEIKDGRGVVAGDPPAGDPPVDAGKTKAGKV